MGTLGASLLGNLLTDGKGIMRAGDGIVRAGEGSKKKIDLLLPFHPLTNIEISEYYENEPRFNGVYSRNNLPNQIKRGVYVIHLDKYESTGTQWVSLCIVKAKYTVYLDSFGIEHIPKKINIFINNETAKSSAIARIKSNIFRIEYKHMIQLCADIFV